MRWGEVEGERPCTVSSFQTWLQNTVAEVEQAAARLPSLSSRVSYAVRKVHTIQGG